MFFNAKSSWLRGITVAIVMLLLAFGGQMFAFGQAESAPASAEDPSHTLTVTTPVASDEVTKADNITVNQSAVLELVAEVPGAYHIEAMVVRDAAPNEIVFSTVWPEAFCGQGNAEMWKLTLDPVTGDFASVIKKQTLSAIQVTRGTVGELSDGTLITGGGWCGTKPAHYSTDGGETWATANVGSVYPPNSTFSFIEFNGEGYVGTGYDPHHGEVYRWTGNGTWDLAFDAGSVQNIVLALAEHQGQLFIGTIPYQHLGSCADTSSVYVSSDGQNFSPTEGIPGCEGVWHLLNVGGQLIARTRGASGDYVYLWDGSVWTHIGDWGLSYSYDGPPHTYHRRVVTANGIIYAGGVLDDGVSQPGIYKSSDLGLTWESVVDLAGVGSLLLHDDTLYIGAGSNTTDTAHIYRLNLPPLALTAISPLNASHDVLPTAPITATFNQAIDSSSVNSNTFALHGTQSQGLFNGSYTPSNGDLTVELAHSDDFMPGELLQVTITTDTLSASGQPLTKPHVWQFRTAVAGGTGQFVDSGQNLSNAHSFDVVLGDVDGDRDLDAFVANAGQTSKVWLNDGVGVFIDSGQSLDSATSTTIALGDLDGDEDLDAFIGNGIYGNNVFLNDGTGVFIDSGQSFGTSLMIDIALGDVDGDGDLDAFVANRNNQANKVWLNDGAGNFSDNGQSLGSLDSQDVALGDVDGDGDLDAFVANSSSDNANQVWLNDGGGFFTDSGQSLGNSASDTVVLGDIDADGDLDALVGNSSDTNRILLNDGAGIFSDSGQGLGTNGFALELADLDQDGDLDAFVTKYTQGNEVWENDGTGSFSNRGQSLANFASVSLALGDVDGDGDVDAFVGNFNNQANKVWLNELPSNESLLAIHALAFNGGPTAPANLSPLFPEAMDGIVAATEGAPEKRAIVLVDQDGEADTRIFEVVDGAVTQIVGLPDSSGVLAQPSALNEYDMTDGNTLGGFLKWTLDEYATPETKTTFSYVSHGTFLAPAVDLSTIFTDTTTLNHHAPQATPLFPLPSVVYVKSRLTDHYPQQGLITPHALQVALDVGTDGGSNPLDVLDLVHCFSASVEQFYELSNPNGTPYSETMVGSPNYSYFAPEMLGRALAALDAADDAATMANSIISAYDEVIEEADQADGDADVDHPRTLVALESSKVPAIKTLMDEISSYIMQEFASNATATKDKLAAAYSNTNAYYDTTYCPAQDWALAAPDGLVDINAFMSQMATEFGTLSGTGLRALQVAGAVDQAVISHTAQNGTPWFAEPLTPTWTLSDTNISGLALYADLEGVVDGTERDLSWHSHFYTDTMSIDNPNDNPYPYLFVQGGFNGQTWGDVFSRFWDVKRQTEGLTTRTSLCLPEFPPVLQEGELSIERVILPITGTVYLNYASPVAAAIRTEHASTNPLVRFNISDASNTLVFSDTVAAGYLVTGTHYIEATKVWTPTITGSFTLEVIVDPDNRFLEADESNNSATMSDDVFIGNPFPMSASTLNNRQWFDSQTIDLTINSSEPLDFLVVQLYEYVPGVAPNTQVPSTPHEIVIPSPSLPNVSFDLPLTVNPGPLTLHLWGIADTDINQGLVEVTFNYAPPSHSLGINNDYYLFDGATGDAISITLSVESGDANLYIWQPGNLWTAQTVNVTNGQAGTIGFSPAHAGEYLVMVEGLTADTQYTISSLRNGQVGGLAPLVNRGNTNSSTTDVTTIQKLRPTFIEPIPQVPSAQIPATIASSVTLQGRSDVSMPHPRFSVPLNVSLTIPSESSPTYTFTPTTDDYGRFTITGIEPGSYEVRVKKATSLQTLVTHEFTAGSNNLDVGTLYEGDANNENYVTIHDFSILASTFAKCAADDGYDERADFNGDGCITLLDFSLLASNFGQGGNQEPAREPATSQASLNGATLLVESLANAVKVGNIFTATVLIEADNQAIDAAQVNLNFDPTVIEVQQLSANDQLPLELLNEFDNSSGTIDFAAGTLSDFPSGADIELLHIQFKALAPTEGTTLAFQFDTPRHSDVTFGGSSVFLTHSDGTIIINIPTAINLKSFDAANWAPLPLISSLLLALMAIVSLSLGWRYRRT